MGKNDPYIIGVVNSKGGGGKSTISINLAIALAEIGYDVLVIDMDDQGSSLYWFGERYEGASPIKVAHLGVKQIRKQARQLGQGSDFVILDGKGSRDKAVGDILARAALQVADFSVIPIIPDELNRAATEDFIEDVLIPMADVGELSAGLLVNRVKNTILARQYEEHYRTSEINCFKTNLPDLNIFAECMSAGKAVFQLNYADKGSIRFLDFFDELCNVIGIKNGKKRLSGCSKKSKARARNGSNKVNASQRSGSRRSLR